MAAADDNELAANSQLPFSQAKLAVLVATKTGVFRSSSRDNLSVVQISGHMDFT